MAIISNSVSVVNGTTVQNVLSGDIFEFLRADSTIKMGIVAAAALCVATFKIGDGIVFENSPISVEAAAGGGVTANRDMKYVDAGRGGDRLSLTVTNGAGAPIVVYWHILIV